MRMKILLAVLIMTLMILPVNALAMAVDYIPDYQWYKPANQWTGYTGIPIDDAYAGFTLLFYSNVSKVLNLNSPDGTNPYWWVWIALHNTNMNNSDMTQIVPNPHDLRAYVRCGGTGGWYNITSTITNYTWNSGYAVFRLSWDTEEMIPFATGSYSPTGKPLYGLNRDCIFGVDDSSYDAGDWVTMSVWAQNPSKNAICSVDSSVQYIQSAVTAIIDINLQIWQMLFQIFSIIVILGAIFGIPLLVFKLIKWLMDELKGKKKVF